MSKISSLSKKKAQRLHDLGEELHDQGDDEAALKKYLEALNFDPERPETCYNIGLVYKYRNDWANSLDFTRRAFELDPDDQATRWNMAIAATALHDWKTARLTWRAEGIEIASGDGPIEGDLGSTPVRLNPDDDGEVVWSRRIDPVRARITNIPLPRSGFAYGDLVLHDGAPVGHRLWNERKYSVFNVMELFEVSLFSTFKLIAEVPGEPELQVLHALFERYELSMEDWTSSIHTLCKACSEGTPHEHHDRSDEDGDEWTVEREIGIAAKSLAEIERVLADQAAAGIKVKSIICELSAQDRIDAFQGRK